MVDVDAVAEPMSHINDVIVSRNYKYMCSDPGQELIINDIREYRLDRVVVAACSPRIHELTFRKALENAGLNPYLLEMANIREQVSWVHNNKEQATLKAIALVAAAINRVRWHEQLEKRQVDIHPATLIVGGGIAGMTAALAAHDKGHRVSLYEKTGRLGGQLFLAAAPPGREEFAQFARDLARQVELRQIPVVFNKMVDETLIQAEKPDHILLAAGSSPWVPDLPGLDLPHVVHAWDVLENKVPTGTRVAIIGGGAVGVETALFLAEKGTLSADMVKFLLVNRAEDPETLYEMATKGSKTILLIEMLDKIGKDIGKSTKWGMMQDLGRFGIQTLAGTKVAQITPEGLEVEQGGQIQQIKADTVVLAAGSKPDTRLASMVKNTGIPFDLIGDAQRVATAFDAVHSGYRAGIAIE